MPSDSRMTVRVSSQAHGYDGHRVLRVVDPVQHAVRAASRAVAIGERRLEALSDPLWVLQQGTHDELVCCEGDSFGKYFAELASSCRGDDQLVTELHRYADDRRCCIAPAS